MQELIELFENEFAYWPAQLKILYIACGCSGGGLESLQDRPPARKQWLDTEE